MSPISNAWREITNNARNHPDLPDVVTLKFNLDAQLYSLLV
jgi:hypothetical protein